MNILKVPTDKRALGNKGEIAAVRYLRRHGYRIKKRNYVAVNKEIDIIAENRDTVAFVEVKTRTEGCYNPSEPRPASALTKEKRRGIIACAKVYAAFEPTKKQLRFDVIEVMTDARGKISSINHMIDAFRQDG